MATHNTSAQHMLHMCGNTAGNCYKVYWTKCDTDLYVIPNGYYKVERLFSSISYRLHYIDFRGSLVTFYDITPSTASAAVCCGGSIVVAASHALVAAAFW